MCDRQRGFEKRLADSAATRVFNALIGYFVFLKNSISVPNINITLQENKTNENLHVEAA